MPPTSRLTNSGMIDRSGATKSRQHRVSTISSIGNVLHRMLPTHPLSTDYTATAGHTDGPRSISSVLREPWQTNTNTVKPPRKLWGFDSLPAHHQQTAGAVLLILLERGGTAGDAASVAARAARIPASRT